VFPLAVAAWEIHTRGKLLHVEGVQQRGVGSGFGGLSRLDPKLLAFVKERVRRFLLARMK
jgi:hypothetical protein